MADLVDRLANDLNVTGRNPIPIHQFTGYVTLWGLGFVTDQQMLFLFDLQGDELRQAQQIRATYNSKNATNKLYYINTIIAISTILNSPPELRNNNSPYFDQNGNMVRSEIFGDLEIAG